MNVHWFICSGRDPIRASSGPLGLGVRFIKCINSLWRIVTSVRRIAIRNEIYAMETQDGLIVGRVVTQ